MLSPLGTGLRWPSGCASPPRVVPVGEGDLRDVDADLARLALALLVIWSSGLALVAPANLLENSTSPST